MIWMKGWMDDDVRCVVRCVSYLYNRDRDGESSPGACIGTRYSGAWSDDTTDKTLVAPRVTYLMDSTMCNRTMDNAGSIRPWLGAHPIESAILPCDRWNVGLHTNSVKKKIETNLFNLHDRYHHPLSLSSGIH